MNNIFENAKFGDKFRTRDGRMAIYIRPWKDMHFLLTNEDERVLVKENGLVYHDPVFKKDVMAEWQEPINKEELNRLAEESNPNNPHGDTYEVCQYFGFDDGFKVGYRKAVEGK